MDFDAFKCAVIAQAKAMGITEYELYYRGSQSTSVSAFQHELNQFTGSTDGGVCFRCIVNGKMGYASTEELSEAQAAAIVCRAADNAAVMEAEEPVTREPRMRLYRSRKAWWICSESGRRVTTGRRDNSPFFPLWVSIKE